MDFSDEAKTKMQTPEGKRELAEKAYKLAYDYDKQFGACPQCVLAAVRDTLGIVDDDLVQSSHGFSGGGGLLGTGTCGALAGGLMAISCIHGRPPSRFGKGRFMRNYELAKKLTERFVQEYGGVTCNETQAKVFGRAYNLWSADDYAIKSKTPGNEEKCPSVAGNVAKWTVQILVGDEMA